MYATADSPYYRIDNYTYLRFDAQFEMYLVYFTGNPLNPRFQQPLAKVPWNWGGSIMFSSPGVYSSYTLYPPAQLRPSVPTSTIRNSAPDLGRAMEPCSAQSASNPINNSKFFVHQQYTDFLGYEPDQGGWDYWTSQIDYCSDQECTNARRAAVALAIYLAAPFMQDSAFANQNTHTYNDAFVTYCYRGFLRREPDDGGKAFWVSILDNQISTGNCNYTGVAGAFISSDEYRSRFGSP